MHAVGCDLSPLKWTFFSNREEVSYAPIQPAQQFAGAHAFIWLDANVQKAANSAINLELMRSWASGKGAFQTCNFPACMTDLVRKRP